MQNYKFCVENKIGIYLVEYFSPVTAILCKFIINNCSRKW